MIFQKTNQPNFSFTGDPIAYIVPSWNDLERECITVAHQVKDSQIQFDTIVTLAKGGWPMTRSLADFTSIPEIASIGVKFYTGINQKVDNPIVYQDLPIKVKSQRILLFDDVADSGGSLHYVSELLHKRGAALVKTATLFYKPHSTVRPDYFGESTTAWIIFPFEILEMSRLLQKKWSEQGVPEKKIKERFSTMGFNARIL